MKIFRKILFFATLVAIPVTILSSCDIFQDGDINDYVGTYKCTTSYESEMSYYWGSDKELSTTEPFNFGSIITIHSDKKVEFHPRNSQETYWGKVRVFKEYCYLIDIPGLEDNYKFELVATNTSKLKGLSYSYRSQSYGVDYQYTKRGIVLTAFIDPSDYSNYVGEYELKGQKDKST